MGQQFINGAQYAFATTAGTKKTVTDITNAAPAVADTTTPPVEGDILLLDNSNWTDLNGQAVRVGTVVAATSFEMDGIDTTNLSRYPDGEGAGTDYVVMTDFVSLSQVRSIANSGGDFNSFDWSYVGDRGLRQRSRPTDANPIKLTFTLDYDPTLDWHQALDDITQNQMQTVMRETLPNGDVLLYAGYIAYNKNPTRDRNQNQTVTAVMSINSDIIRYAAAP